MKRKLSLPLIGACVALVSLAACTTPRSPDQLSQKTVNYQCGPGGQHPLTVQYTFQGREALSARIIYQNQVVELPRSTASNVDMAGNTFRSENYTWITRAFDYDTVDSARGDMLTREVVPDTVPDRPHPTTLPPTAGAATPMNGTRSVPPEGSPMDEVSTIIVRDCVPVATTST